MDDQHHTLTNDRTEWEEEEGGLVSARYVVEPSPGTHVIFWRGNWIRLDRVREQQQVIGKKIYYKVFYVSFKVDVIGGVPWETVTLTALGRKRELLLRMVEEARKEGTVTE